MRIVANDTDCPDEAEILCLIPASIAPVLRSEWAKVMIPKLENKIHTAILIQKPVKN